MTATAVIATPVTETTVETLVIDLPDETADLFDQLSNVKYVRQEAEKKEKALKQQILAMLPEQSRTQKFVLRAKGVIRANVRIGHRPNASLKDLLAGFPEAYEAVVTESEFPVLDPA